MGAEPGCSQQHVILKGKQSAQDLRVHYRKNSYNSVIKGQITHFKKGKRPHKRSLQRDGQMANRRVERHSTLFVTKETQIRTE